MVTNQSTPFFRHRLTSRVLVNVKVFQRENFLAKAMTSADHVLPLTGMKLWMWVSYCLAESGKNTLLILLTLHKQCCIERSFPLSNSVTVRFRRTTASTIALHHREVHSSKRALTKFVTKTRHGWPTVGLSRGGEVQVASSTVVDNCEIAYSSSACRRNIKQGVLK
jgi:hypothetical protein